MPIDTTVANDIANVVLDYFVRSPAFSQTTQDKPLLAALNSSKKTFPAGKQYVSEPVKGVYMNTVSGFFAGYSQDSQLTFTQSQNVLQAQYAWKEVHAGLIITWTELKQDGITVKDNQKTTEHSTELTRLVGILEDRLLDYAESYARAKNAMLWADGTQDTNQVPGIQAILPLVYGTVGGLAQATYPWWQHILVPGIAVEPTNSTLIETLRANLIQLRRYGGRPNKALCGSAFLAGLRAEISGKGLFTQTGFDKATDIGMGSLSIGGIGTFDYDPTLDDLGQSKACYVMDMRNIRLRPMEDEDDKTLTPERPYDYMVFLKSMTWTGALESRMQNCNGVFSIQ